MCLEDIINSTCVLDITTSETSSQKESCASNSSETQSDITTSETSSQKESCASNSSETQSEITTSVT